MTKVIKKQTAHIAGTDRTVELEISFVHDTHYIYSVAVSNSSDLREGDKIETIELPSQYSYLSKQFTVIGIRYDVFKNAHPNFDEGQRIANKDNPVGKIIIPPSITHVEHNAFSNIFADTVVWGDNCNYIPVGCFYNSQISSFENMENVNGVLDAAFQLTSGFDEFNWPPNAEFIPPKCFFQSEIKKLNGIENVTDIEDLAFIHCKRLESFDWPEGCSSVPSKCFFNCTSLSEVHFKDFTTVDIAEEAFWGTAIKTLDLSDLMDCSIGEKAVPKDTEVIMPSNFYRV
jgi:hypothetical protein